MFRTRSGESGFSVIELLVVVAIILTIVAIAVPRMLQGRVKAKEAAAISSIKAIQNAQQLYSQTYPDRGYAPTLAYLGPSSSGNCDSPTSTCLIDPILASGIKGGYMFEIKGDGNTPVAGYTVTATPDGSHSLGSSQCIFESDQSGVIKGRSVNQQSTSSTLLSEAISQAGCGGK